MKVCDNRHKPSPISSRQFPKRTTTPSSEGAQDHSPRRKPWVTAHPPTQPEMMSAAKRQKNTAHGVSRGSGAEDSNQPRRSERSSPPEGRSALHPPATHNQPDILLIPHRPNSKYSQHKEAWHLLMR